MDYDLPTIEGKRLANVATDAPAYVQDNLRDRTITLFQKAKVFPGLKSTFSV